MRFYINEEELGNEEIFDNPARNVPVQGNLFDLPSGRALPAPVQLNNKIDPMMKLVLQEMQMCPYTMTFQVLRVEFMLKKAKVKKINEPVEVIVYYKSTRARTKEEPTPKKIQNS